LFRDSHSHILSKLRAELDATLGPWSAEKAEDVTWDMVNNLPYLECVIKELQRFHTVVPCWPVRVVTDPQGLHFGGYHIQQGSLIFTNTRNIHLNSKYWDKPTEFLPERWEGGFTPAPGTYAPFGEGPQKCIGLKMAHLEMKTFIARLVHRYDFKLVEGQKLEVVTSVTHGYKNGILFDVMRRQA
ncbi:hypothetical protein HDV05_008076, partial [Chytridiales sp. JEL 0842]